MRRFIFKRIVLLLSVIYTFSVLTGYGAGALYEKSGDGGAVTAFGTDVTDCDGYAQTQNGEIKVSSRIYELLFGKSKEKKEPLYLIPGGDVFGIRLKEAYVTVSDSVGTSPLKRGDKILSVNDIEVYDADGVAAALSECKGGAVKIAIIRGGEKMTVTAIPKYSDGTYKLGVTLKRSTCGIGTVTFTEPQTRAFGGLGHGVCDENGNLLEIESGEVCGVILGGVTRGETGKPGELSGMLSKKHTGRIDKNTECGVFGILSDIDVDSSAAIPVGLRSELKLGEAEIISTVKSGKKASYKIEITEIDADSQGSKSFKIKVTDPVLIAITGGIVRGMSGSPVIQNGKLVGAVTHVMVGDPTEGYGVFIENMLASGSQDAVPKAA